MATITGTPTASGTFNYTVTLTGGCGTTISTGRIIVTPNNTSTLSSAVGTDAQTKCINTAITTITYGTTGATGATFVGLPTGVTGSWAGNVATITGTPTASGPFIYTVTLTGGCGTTTSTGRIIVTPNNTSTLSSAVGTDAQTKCINTAITDITYGTTGATGATFIGLPTGVTGSWAGNVATITGTPTASGPFNYTITLTGGCGTITSTGTITVTSANTASIASSTPTLCINSPLTAITHSTTGATGIGSTTGLPTGINAVWASNTITLSGTPTEFGTFDYSISLTGGCGNSFATGRITVNAKPTISPITGKTDVCIGETTTLSSLTIGGSWTSTSLVVATINSSGVVTPLSAGATIINYSVAIGGCTNSISTTVNVFALPVVANIIGKDSLCIGDNLTLTNATIGGVWSSSSTVVATVLNGLVSGLSAGKSRISYTVTTNGCSSSKTLDINVNSYPVVPAINGVSDVCVGSTIQLTNSTPLGVWSSSNITVASINAFGLVTGKVAGNTTINYKVTNANCSTTVGASVTVKEALGVSAIIGTTSICIGANSQLTNGTSGGTWTSSNPSVAVVSSTGLVTSVSVGSTTIRYDVITNGVCPQFASVNFTVNEIPTVNTISNIDVCNGSNVNTINFTGSGTPVFQWTNNNTKIGLAAIGTGNINSFTAKGTSIGGSSEIAVINVTPVANGCTGISKQFLITVKPLDNAGFNYTSNSFCQLDANPTPIITGLTGGTFTSSSADLVINNTNGNVNLLNSKSGYYQITYQTKGTCPNDSIVDFAISDLPTLNSVSDQQICEGSNFNAINFAGSPGTIFNWINDNTNIGLAATGTGNIASFTGTGTNIGGNSITGKIIVTPTSGSCVGIKDTFLLTVNPKENPSFTYPSNSFCSTLDPNPIANITGKQGGVFTMSPVGAIFNANTGAITLASSNAGTYSLTYTTNGTCSNSQSLTITIGSNPSVNAITSQTICSGSNFNAINFSGTAGTTFNWTSSNPALLGLPSNGVGNINAFTGAGATLANPLVTSTIIVTPKIGSCTGASKSFTLSVSYKDDVKISYAESAYCTSNSNPTPVISGASGGVFTSSPVGLIINSTTGLINIPASAEGVYKITYITSGTCGDTATTTVGINNSPLVNNIPDQTVCSGINFTDIKFTGTLGTTYEWSNSITSIGLASSGIGDIASFTGTNSSNSTASSTVTVTPRSGACTGAIKTFKLTVNPSEDASFIYSSNSVCQNNIDLTPVISGTTGGVFSSTSGLSINSSTGKINIVSSNPGLYTIIYKTSGTCFSIKSFALKINETPVVSDLSNMEKCEGSNFDPISFTGTVGASFSWTNSNQSIGLTSSGQGNISSFKATGTSLGGSPTSAVISVIPIMNGCSGTSKSMILTTNSLDNPAFAYGSNSYCFTELNPTPTISGRTGGTFSVVPASGLLIDASTGTLDLTSATAGNYQITYNTNGFCKNDSTITMSIGSAPLAQPVTSQTVCQGSSFNAIDFQGAPGTVYEWTNSNTAIGLGDSGSGNINSFLANGTSVGGSTISSIITVMPKIGTCTGIPITFSLTVKPLDNATFNYTNTSFCKNQTNPTPIITGLTGGTFTSTPIGISMNSVGTINLATSTSGNYTVSYTTHGECPNVTTFPISIGSSPTVNSVSDQTVCSGSNFSKISFTGNPGTVFNWTNTNSAIGLSSSGTGDISSFKSLSVGSSIIVVTPIIGTCAGTSKTFTLSVNAVQNSTIQYGQSSYCITDSDPTPVQTGPLNGVFSASPTGLVLNSTSGMINLATSSPGNYIVSYNLSAQCSTSSSTTISVGSAPTVNTVSVAPICNGATFNAITFTGTPGTQFHWTNSNINIGLPASGTGNIASFVGVNNSKSDISSNITVTPVVGTCIGTPKTFNLTIRPSDDPSFSYSSTNICFNDSDISPSINGTSGGVFTSVPIGLSLNSNSGKINVSNSLPGNYNVTYLTNGNCPKAKTEAIVINPMPYVNNLTVSPKCQGSIFSSITFTGSQNTTFNWKNSNTTIGLSAAGVGLIPSFTASGTIKNGASAIGIITVSPEINGCKGGAMSFPVTVLSLDDPTFKYPKSSICQTDLNPLPIITGTTGGVFTSSPSGFSLNPTTGRITIGTSFVGNYNITYTTNGSCPKDTTISIQLNSLPEVNTISNQNRCFGDSFNPITFSGTPNTKFNWVNSNSNIGLPASGNGNIAAFIAKGTVFGGSSIVSNVIVTPEINGCFGSTKSFDLTVNPIDNPAFHYSDNSFCTTQSDPTPIIDGTVGGVFSSQPIGLSINTSTGKINLISSTPGMYQIKYTTPGNCKDDSTVTIGIGSNPSVDDVDDQSFCQGDMFDPVNFTGNAGTIFEWVNSNINIGIPASGAGNIIGFKALGTIDGGADAIASITVTPRVGTCIGSHVNYKYKVRANPKIVASIANSSKQDTSFCKEGSAILSATGASKNENFIWTPHTSLVGNLGIGATVTTKTDTTQQYIVRGQSQFGCYNYDTLSIYVYNPKVDQKRDTMVCAGSLINSIPFVSNLNGTTFEWANSNANIGLGFNGTGNINGFIANNNTNTVKQTAIISVTPKYLISSINKTCVGPVMKFSIDVNKLDDPSFNGYLAQYCANETSNTFPTITGFKGGVFSALPSGLALNSNSGEIFPISSKAGSYSVKYTTNGVCPKSDSIYLFINPLITATISGADTVCVNAVSPQIKFKGFNGVAPYIFKYKVNGGAILTISSDPGKEEVSVAVPTNKSGIYTYELVSVEESSSSQCKNSNVFGIQNVIVNELPTAQITTTDASVCLGANSPEIRITGINGVSPFTFTYFISKDGNPFGPAQNVSTGQGQYLASIPVNTSSSGIYNYTVNIVKNGDDLSCSNNINISQTVTIKPLPTAIVTSKPSGVCMNGDATIEFTASNGTPPFTFVYSINNSGNQTIKTNNTSYTITLKANTNSSGIFNYKIVSISDGDNTSCQNNNVNANVDLIVTPGTKVNKVQDINVCVNEKSDTIEFTGGVSGTKYEWYSNNTTVGVNGSGIGNILPFVSKNTSGSTTNISRITVIPSVGQCIGDTMKFDIVVRPKPKAKINAPNTVCPGDSILLEGVGNELKYVWTPNVSCITCNPVIAKPTQNTTYKAFVSDKYNCFDSTEFDVVVYRRPDINVDEPVVCGEPQLVILKGKDNNTYTYSDGVLDGVPFMPKKGINPYIVFVKDNLGCKNSDTLNVYVIDKPVSKFTATPEAGLASDAKPLNVLLTNKSSAASDFEWYFRNGDQSPLIKNTLEPVTALYKKPGIYVITLISKNGKCIDSSLISIKIDKLDTPRVEIAPNVFTPDNDGTNDAFFITVKNAKDIHVLIFNRWGNPIYEMTETSQSWDGTINGKDADEGVYFYQYEIEGTSGEKIKGQGYVQLIRN